MSFSDSVKQERILGCYLKQNRKIIITDFTNKKNGCLRYAGEFGLLFRIVP
jgi:hypothetical protein